MRQVADNGDNLVMRDGVHGLDHGTAAPPKLLHLFHRRWVTIGQRCHDAIAAFE